MQTKIPQIGKIVLALVLVAVMALTFSHRASAAPQDDHRILVDTTADNNTPDSVITLREALLIARNGTNNSTGLGRPLTDAEANKLYGCSLTGYEPDHWWIDNNSCGAQVAETIYFYLENCPCTVAPTSTMEYVPDGTTIDGYAGEPGASVNTSKKGMNAQIMIHLYGGDIAANNVPGLEMGSNVTIRGLEVYGFSGAGIVADGVNDTLLGNIIDNNAADGVILSGSNNHVGSVDLAGRNAIYQNGWHGVEAFVNSNANQIVNNLIGVPADNDKATGNTYSGISLYSSSNYISGNTIAYNGNDGIVVLSGIHNNFYNNSFHDNYLLGVDLGNDGVTKNDAMDSDTGANNLQNYPTLQSANAATKTVAGKLVSTPNTSFQIDLFKSAGCDASGYGEGTTRLGFVTVNTNAKGVANFSTTRKFKHGNAITAVASGSEGTSEFSKCVIAQ